MPTTVKAIAATSATGPLLPLTITRRDPDATDIVIAIKFAGVCHSDIHTVRGEWGRIAYPQVVGHEIAGIVSAVGASVHKYKVGDRVGVGCMVNSCRACANCVAGEEQHCTGGGNIGTYRGKDPKEGGRLTQGGYAQSVVVDQDFVLRIPDNLPLDKAAPLLCAGITMFSPLNYWNVGPGKRVGIIGLGGLGHMGVKIAHAMGAEVTVLSQSLTKKQLGLDLGADHYFATNDPSTFTALQNHFDLILNTVSSTIDLDLHMRTLARNGTLVEVGAPPQPMTLRAFTILSGRRSLAGSLIGGINETQEMLDFCAKHNIVSDVEVIPASYVNEAYERVVKSDVRFRFVIDIATL